MEVDKPGILNKLCEDFLDGTAAGVPLQKRKKWQLTAQHVKHLQERLPGLPLDQAFVKRPGDLGGYKGGTVVNSEIGLKELVTTTEFCSISEPYEPAPIDRHVLYTHERRLVRVIVTFQRTSRLCQEAVPALPVAAVEDAAGDTAGEGEPQVDAQ